MKIRARRCFNLPPGFRIDPNRHNRPIPADWWDDEDVWQELEVGSVYDLTADEKKRKRKKRRDIGFNGN